MDIFIPDKRLRRYIRVPRNIDMMVALRAGDVQGPEAWEVQPMGAAEATRYRAAVARLIFIC